MKKSPQTLLLAALLVPSLSARSVSADEGSSSVLLAPIFVKKPTSVENVTAPVEMRLRQMGELPRVLTDPSAQCEDVDCGRKLVAGFHMPSVRLVGGAMQKEGARLVGSLYWLDLGSGKSVARQFSCERCDPGEQMAHHMAMLLEQAPGDKPEDCAAAVSSPTQPAEDVQRARTQGVNVSVDVKAGAKVKVATIQAAAQRALLQLGVPFVSLAPSNHREPTNNPRASLSIELSGNRRSRGAVEVVSLSLLGGSAHRSVRFFCPPKSCQHNLAVQLSANLAMLFDSGVPNPVAAISADCLMPGRKPVLVAQRDGIPNISDERPPPSPADPKPPILDEVPPPPPPPRCEPSTWRKALRSGGATLLGLGAGGILTGGILWSQNGAENGRQCMLDGKSVPCGWNTRTATAIGFGLGSGGVAIGSVLLGLSYLPNRRPACGVAK